MVANFEFQRKYCDKILTQAEKDSQEGLASAGRLYNASSKYLRTMVYNFLTGKYPKGAEKDIAQLLNRGAEVYVRLEGRAA